MASKEQNNVQKEYNKLLSEARRLISAKKEAEEKSYDIAEKIFELAKGQLDLFEGQGEAIDGLNTKLKEEVKTLDKANKSSSKLFKNISDSSGKLTKSFNESSKSLLSFLKIQNPLSGITDKFGDAKDFVGGLGNNLKGAGKFTKVLGAGAIGAGLAFGGILAIGKKIFDIISSVDTATANLIKTTGILDSSLSKTLIEATEQSALLGGNVELAAGAIQTLTESLSPAISLSGKLVGNVANVAERFGLGAENAVRLTQIVSELTSTTFEDASSNIESLIDGLGRLGPAVVRNLVESYDSVIDRFGISLQSLKQQTLQATQLGLSLSKVADVSEKLLDFQSSISSEFRASAILGRQINLQKARQLAFEGNIVGALNETLDRVEEIGDFEQLNFFQRKAIADATGLSVSELQKELNLRRQLGVQGKIEAATRDSALGKIEEINRRIQSVLFKVLASPSVQRAFDNFADSIIDFLQSPQFNRVVNNLGNVVDKVGRFLTALIEGRVGFERNNLGIPTGIKVDDTVNDAVITPQGQVIKTNPRDYIMATQNPQILMSSGNDVMVSEMIGLLRELKQNGVRADVNLDGKKVSKQIALSNRY